MYLGDTLDAATAERWGLVERIAEDLDAAIRECRATLIACGPEALRRQKALMRLWEDGTITAAIDAGTGAHAAARGSDAPRRMTAAFTRRRR